MIEDIFTLRPRYNEVDKMGYVYHSNYVVYCHQARTEMMRKMGICDFSLENKNIMMPVISFNINYRNPAHYDQEITIKTSIKKMPKVRFSFDFLIRNKEGKIICEANSTLVFVDNKTRKPMFVPEFIAQILSTNFNKSI